MYVLKNSNEARCHWTRSRTSDAAQLRSDRGQPESEAIDAPRQDAAVDGRAQPEVVSKRQALVYLDPREFTRDCVGSWLQNSLLGFTIWLFADPDEIEPALFANDEVGAIIINAGPDRISAPSLACWLSRVSELLPISPVVILSDYEDPESIREAFALGVRGYIPTTLASSVALGAVQLVCLGGTFAPAAPLVFQSDLGHGSADKPQVGGLTDRQAQIVDCLRRGMANKMIAYELNMKEGTVKVHLRNIMRKLNATNRTQVAYMTRGLFQDADCHHLPDATRTFLAGRNSASARGVIGTGFPGGGLSGGE